MKPFDISKAPLEIERKFLIALPDIGILKQQSGYRKLIIEQSYLEQSAGRKGGRIRKITEDDKISYIYTYKEKISELTRHEFETEISAEEYSELLSHRAKGSVTIHKERHVFLYQGLTYELDIYDFWSDQATLEAEVESEDTPIPIPPFVTLIKEISFDKRYRNSQLAFHHGMIN